MRAYISGGMTGWPNYNREAFEEAAAFLRGLGHRVVTPVEMDEAQNVDLVTEDGFKMQDEEYEDVLERDLSRIDVTNYDAVIFIRGWQTSGGAGREGRRAIREGLRLFMLYGAPGGWDLAEISPEWFLDNSRTERLRREEVPA